MNTKLNYIHDWPCLARQANWSVARLARLTGVTQRALHRHFLGHMGQTPKGWLTSQRRRLAFELLRDGASVKETAARLGYKHAETFSRTFKKWSGLCPNEMASVSESHGMSDLVRPFPLKPGRTMI